MMNTEEILSIFKKNAGVLGQSNRIYPTDADLGCIQIPGTYDRRAGWDEASIAGRHGRCD
jgi:hypothetical protein